MRNILTRYLRRDPAGESYRLVEQKLEPPMLALALLFIPVILGPLLADLSAASKRGMETTGWAIWAAFGVEYVWLLYLAPSRRDMLRTHKLDLIVVVVPFLRPLRVLRSMRLSSAASGAGRAMSAARRIGGRPGFRPFFSIISVVLVAGAALALAFEHQQPGATMETYPDALWWAFVTSTTVGYGDQFPVTGGGQIVAVVLMIFGIATLSLLTASVVALFVEDDDKSDMVEIRARLDRIERALGVSN